MNFVFSAGMEALKELFALFREIAPKIFHICLWAIVGVILLPCVFVANHFFPMWVKWGEEF
jgi:hypothetical protein